MGKRMKWEGAIYLSASRLFSKGCLQNREDQIQAALFVVSGFQKRLPFFQSFFHSAAEPVMGDASFDALGPGVFFEPFHKFSPVFIEVWREAAFVFGKDKNVDDIFG